MLIDLSSSQDSPKIIRPKNNLTSYSPYHKSNTTIEEDVCFPQQNSTTAPNISDNNSIDYDLLDQWVQEDKTTNIFDHQYYNDTLRKYSDARYGHFYDDYTNVSLLSWFI